MIDPVNADLNKYLDELEAKSCNEDDEAEKKAQAIESLINRHSDYSDDFYADVMTDERMSELVALSVLNPTTESALNIYNHVLMLAADSEYLEKELSDEYRTMALRLRRNN